VAAIQYTLIHKNWRTGNSKLKLAEEFVLLGPERNGAIGHEWQDS